MDLYVFHSITSIEISLIVFLTFFPAYHQLRNYEDGSLMVGIVFDKDIMGTLQLLPIMDYD